MKIFKKLFAALLAANLIAGILIGCSVSSASGTANLPVDGIIQKTVFEDAKNHSKILTFRGKSGSVFYSWFFDGASIVSPADQNLKVDFMDAGNDLDGAVSSSKTVKIQFNEKNLIQAQTTLKVEFPELWNAQKVRIYQKSVNGIHNISEAPLNNDKISSVTFPVSDTGGNLYLVTVDSGFHENTSSLMPNLPESSSGSGSAKGSLPAASSNVTKDENSSSAATLEENQNSKSPSSVKKPDSAAGTKSAPSSSAKNSKDQYQTDPTPAGRPNPVNPQENQKNTKKALYCTLSIDCKTILDHKDQLNKEKESVFPTDGVILKAQKVLFYDGESVFDILLRETKKNEMQMEYKATPAYNSSYIEGIHNLYEFDCGELSGWMYKVNGWYPNYGCSRYELKDGDVVCWRYTCDLGRDVGSEQDVSQK